MKINNRRYTGSKYKLIDWIKQLLIKECPNSKSFFDVFGGTGIVTASVLDIYDKFVINDFLYSNEVIYKAFFGGEKYDKNKLDRIIEKYNHTEKSRIEDNYVSLNFGNKYFSMEDAKIIGFIREDLKQKKVANTINEKEYYILLASLLYSLDKIANTVGHYDAFIKGKVISSSFKMELVEPYENNNIRIFRQNANMLAADITADIAFIDPPYNSRQYSRFYHILENITKWSKPVLTGTAMKPPAENMSEYCRSKAPQEFSDLISKLNVKYIVVTYNNTYTSKSSSSKNKITLDEILTTLESKGKTKVFEKSHQCFNAGKTEFNDHKELVFITKVRDVV